jgi:hypothetical protein
MSSPSYLTEDWAASKDVLFGLVLGLDKLGKLVYGLN